MIHRQKPFRCQAVPVLILTNFECPEMDVIHLSSVDQTRFERAAETELFMPLHRSLSVFQSIQKQNICIYRIAYRIKHVLAEAGRIIPSAIKSEGVRRMYGVMRTDGYALDFLILLSSYHFVLFQFLLIN